MNMFGWDRCKDKAKFLKVSPLESVKTFKVLIFKQLQGKFVEKRLKNLAKIRLMGVEKGNIGKIGNLFWISYINLNKMSTLYDAKNYFPIFFEAFE